MRTCKSVLKIFLILGLAAGMSAPAWGFLDNKFEKEVKKETGAVKLVREVQRGGYNVVRTEELKNWIDSGKMDCNFPDLWQSIFDFFLTQMT